MFEHYMTLAGGIIVKLIGFLKLFNQLYLSRLKLMVILNKLERTTF